MSHAWLTFGDERAARAMHRGLDHAVTLPAPADVRALHVLVGLRLLARDGSVPSMARGDPSVGRRDRDRRIDGVLMNNPDERGEPHLWAHIQEGVFVEAGRSLEDPALVDGRARERESVVGAVRPQRHSTARA